MEKIKLNLNKSLIIAIAVVVLLLIMLFINAVGINLRQNATQTYTLDTVFGLNGFSIAYLTHYVIPLLLAIFLGKLMSFYTSFHKSPDDKVLRVLRAVSYVILLILMIHTFALNYFSNTTYFITGSMGMNIENFYFIFLLYNFIIFMVKSDEDAIHNSHS